MSERPFLLSRRNSERFRQVVVFGHLCFHAYGLRGGLPRLIHGEVHAFGQPLHRRRGLFRRNARRALAR